MLILFHKGCQHSDVYGIMAQDFIQSEYNIHTVEGQIEITYKGHYPRPQKSEDNLTDIRPTPTPSPIPLL